MVVSHAGGTAVILDANRRESGYQGILANWGAAIDERASSAGDAQDDFDDADVLRAVLMTRS